MARKSRPQQPPSKTLTAEDLSLGLTKLQRRIDELKSFDVGQLSERFDAKAQALEERVNITIAYIFGRNTPEYNDYSIWHLDTLPIVMGGSEHHIAEIRQAYQKGINDAVTKLTSVREMLQERLEDLQGQIRGPEPHESFRNPPGKNQVFIVHGHDELAKQTVARFLEQLGFKPIILHEQPSSGKTLIEKLEAHSLVDFCVVLLTPDDKGYQVAKPEDAKPRVRQNVIMELGLFIGSIGRNRVCALVKGDLEVPSDYHGVLYVSMDDAGAWKLTLAREMKQAGIAVDMNRAV